MKIKAPFILQTISRPAPGTAACERWYIVPFRLWKRRVFNAGISGVGTYMKLSFDYALGSGQYIGTMLFNAGKSTWRQL